MKLRHFSIPAAVTQSVLSITVAEEKPHTSPPGVEEPTGGLTLPLW